MDKKERFIVALLNVKNYETHKILFQYVLKYKIEYIKDNTGIYYDLEDMDISHVNNMMSIIESQ